MAIRNVYKETLSDAPVAGWKAGHVTLYLERPLERVPVEAWIRGPFAIHDLMSGRANLTHIPTGRRIYSFDSKLDAAEAAEKIEPLGEWDAINDQMPPGSELYSKIRPILHQYEIERPWD